MRACRLTFWPRPTGAVRPRRLHRAAPREPLRGDQQPFPQQRRRPVLSGGGVSRSAARRAVESASAATWLAQEMDVQVLPDGADYESSVPYHRLVTELFLGAARVADTAGTPLPRAVPRPAEHDGRLSRRRAAARRPDATGRRCRRWAAAYPERVRTWKPQDPRHLFGPAAASVRARRLGAWSPARGASGKRHGGASMRRARPCIRRRRARALRHFPHAGMTVMRRTRRLPAHHQRHRRHRRLRQPQAQRPAGLRISRRWRAGHRRSRQLRLHVRSRRPKSVSKHAVPQHRQRRRSKSRTSSGPSGCFGCSRRHHPSTYLVRRGSDELEYRGRQSGYARLPARRSCTSAHSGCGWSDGALIIDDKVDGQGTHRLRWHFHFAPGVTIGMAGTDVVEIAARTRG